MTSSDESPSDDDNQAENPRKRYSGRSRTTRWRKKQKRKRLAAFGVECSSSESDSSQTTNECSDDTVMRIKDSKLFSPAVNIERESKSIDDEEGPCCSSKGSYKHTTEEKMVHLQEGCPLPSHFVCTDQMLLFANVTETEKEKSELSTTQLPCHFVSDCMRQVANGVKHPAHHNKKEVDEGGSTALNLNLENHSNLGHGVTSNELQSLMSSPPSQLETSESSSDCDSKPGVSHSSGTSSQTSGSEYCPSSRGWESSGSSDEFSSDLECFVAHYLDEEPEEQPPAIQHDDDRNDYEPHNGGQGDPDNPDDPGDIDADDDPTSSSSEDSDDDNVHEVATFYSNALNRNVRLVQPLTTGEIICLELACAVRHKKTFEGIIDQFKNLNLLFGAHWFPESKTKLWDIILLNKAGIRFHVYCGNRVCGNYIGRRDRLNGLARCRCGYRIAVGKAKFFITLDLKTQLTYFLSIPGIWEKLQYPFHRQKISPTALEDVLDGALYKRLQEDGGPLSNRNNFSFIFNTDGCNPSKKGSLKLWPLFIRINELPPEIRQKFHFPAAIYLDTVEPNFQSFLKPFVQQVRQLETQGIDWRPDGVNEINSKFIALGFNVDSPVRYSMLKMSKWDCAAFGCTYCNHQGVRVAGSQRYPEVNLAGIPPFQDRSHDGMIQSMIQVQRDNNLNNVEGHTGTTVLMLLQHLDLRDGQAEDDLHQDHEGSAAHLTELIMTTQDARVEENMAYVALVRAVDARLLSIKTPSRISRKPRSIDKRGKYNGSEWRNWLLYYCVPCLLGLIKPEYLDILASLSHACFLLSQDSIEQEDIDTAERLLIRVATSFERTFGVARLRYNLHVTTKHKVRCVQNLGNPWAYSTYNFESLNRKMIARVTSPKGAIMQILTRVMLHMTVYAAQYDQRLSEEVRLRVEDILNPYQLKRVQQVGPSLYLVGTGIERAISNAEAEVLVREGIHTQNIVTFKSFLRGNSRFRSIAEQNPNIKSDDSFIYTTQDTFCTIRTICSFVDDNGELKCGLFVTEHDVLHVVPVARHLSTLHNNANADLLHFIFLHQVRCPAVKIIIANVVYAACVPNCLEID